jgi:hypothetical protein
MGVGAGVGAPSVGHGGWRRLRRGIGAAIPRRSVRRLFVVVVGGFGGFLELAVGLVEQVFGLLGVAVHIPLVGLLGFADLVESLIAEALGSGEVGVLVRVDVLDRHLLSEDETAAKDGGSEQTAEHEIGLHSGYLSPWSVIGNSGAR